MPQSVGLQKAEHDQATEQQHVIRIFFLFSILLRKAIYIQKEQEGHNFRIKDNPSNKIDYVRLMNRFFFYPLISPRTYKCQYCFAGQLWGSLICGIRYTSLDLIVLITEHCISVLKFAVKIKWG